MAYPQDIRFVSTALCIVAMIWGSIALISTWLPADRDLDQQTIRLLRNPDNPERMIGPPVLEESMRDFTALGGYAILVLTTTCFAIFARTELGRETLFFFLLTVVGGFLFSVLLKNIFQRDRPSIVPHLSHVSGSTSFPSSHAMMSVIVFVTIGLLLSQLTSHSHLKTLLIAMPLALATLVGVSRVCMGVHFPSDVLGGWFGGLLWTWIAFVIRARLQDLRPAS